MKPRTINILYWTFTGILSLGMLFSGFSGIVQLPSAVEVMKHLGYPIYVNTIIGVAKIIGVIVILQNRFKTIKEWAYSGFTIDFIGAAASIYFVDGIMAALSVIPFFAVLFASYYFWKNLPGL